MTWNLEDNVESILSSERTAISLCMTVVGQDTGRRDESQGSETSEGSRSEMLAGDHSSPTSP